MTLDRLRHGPTTLSTARLLRRKLATAAGVDRFVLGWFVPCWCGMMLAAAAIRALPFRRLAPAVGHNLGPVAIVPLASAAQRRRAGQIGCLVAIVANYAPGRTDCFPQALVAVAFCRIYRVPYALHFGVAPPGAESRAMDAHAWVASGPITIAGGAQSFLAYTPLLCLVSPRP